MIVEALVALLLMVGAVFTVIGSIGLVRLPDFYTRLHGPTKATTLGVGSLIVASVVYFAFIGEGLELRDLLVTIFLFMTAPVSAHLLAKAGLRVRVASVTSRPRETHGHKLGEEGES
jgi:multicomponent K+:H+ antiporter subunit G